MSEILAPPLGFATGSSEPDARVHQRIEDARSLWKARRTFSPEFLNRLDHQIVFHRLNGAQLEQILDIELAKIEAAARASRADPLPRTRADARRLLAEGTDPEHGARP